FFFSSRRRHTRSKRDWSSDVCSSDLFDRLRLRRSVDRYLWVGPTDPSLVAVETVAEQAVRAVVHPAAAQTAIDTVPWTATVIWRLSDQKSAPRFLPTCLRDGEPDFEPRSEEHTSELQSRFDFVCR